MALSELAGSTSHRHLVTKRVLNGYAYWTVRQEVKVKGPPSEPSKSKVHRNELPENKGQNAGK
jgi:hypothetical protein